MAKFCANCGALLNETAVFCGGCGNKISAAPSAPAATEWATVPAVTPAPGLAVPPIADDAPFKRSLSGVFPGGLASPAASPEVVIAPAPAATNPGYAPVTGAVGATSTPYAQIPGSYPVVPAMALPAMAYPPAKKSNLVLKLVIAFVLVVFVGGALALAGIWYAAKRIRAKVHTVASQVFDDGTPSGSSGLGGLLSSGAAQDNGNNGIAGDPCRFLSKAEVSHAVGLPILRTEAQDSGCSYIAKGDPADGTAKHLSSMLKGMGADDRTQQMAQKFAGGLFAQQQATDKDLSAAAQKGEIPVLNLVFTAGHAAAEMKANRAALGHIGATTSAGGGTNLAGIGDEAYAAAGSMILLRKGNVMARMMYISCPCNTENIKPLARTWPAAYEVPRFIEVRKEPPMSFCQTCGAAFAAGATFCPSCSARAQAMSAQPAAQAGLQPNVAGALTYLAGLVTGILFLVIDPLKADRFVRFHAFQSIFFNVAWIALWIVWTIVGLVLGAVTKGLFFLLQVPIDLVLMVGGFALWAFLMYSAYQGKTMQLPVIGALAAKQAGL